MTGKITLAILLLLLPAQSLPAQDIGNISIPDSLLTEKSRLILNGTGIRSKLFFNLYVGGLYLSQASSNPEEIIHSDTPMAIKLHITSSMITSEKMQNATREGFINATNDQTGPLKNAIDTFIAVFTDEIEENDVYDLIYIPETGVQVSKNNKLQTVIPGLAFKKALFGIWLSEKPAQESLKREMLSPVKK